MRLVILVTTAAGALALLGFRAAAESDRVARGKYLVEEVSRCQECHTPRLADGQFDRAKWMKGATLNVQPIEPIKGWHKTAPDITGISRIFQKWGEPALVKFFQTGLSPVNKNAEPPMPIYTMKPEDAEAVVEYLKTLR